MGGGYAILYCVGVMPMNFNVDQRRGQSGPAPGRQQGWWLDLLVILSAFKLARAGGGSSAASQPRLNEQVEECPQLFAPDTLQPIVPGAVPRNITGSPGYYQLSPAPANINRDTAYAIVARPTGSVSVDTMLCLYTSVEPANSSVCDSAGDICAHLRASNNFEQKSNATRLGFSHIQWHAESRHLPVFISVYWWQSRMVSDSKTRAQDPRLLQLYVSRLDRSVGSSTAVRTNNGCTCYMQSVGLDGLMAGGCADGWCDVEPGCAAAYLGKAGGNPYAGWDQCEITTREGERECPTDVKSKDWRVKMKQNADICTDRLEAVAAVEDTSGAVDHLVDPDICNTIISADPKHCSLSICSVQTSLSSLRPGLPTLDLTTELADPKHALSFYCSVSCGTCDNRCPFDGDGICDADSVCPPNSDSDCSCSFKNDGVCDEGLLCPFGSDSEDCCPERTGDGVCDEGRLCPPLSDRLDCFCASTMDGTCDEVKLPAHSAARAGSAGSCALFSDYTDCIRTADRRYCPPKYVNNDECDDGEKCPCGTDSDDCADTKSTCSSEHFCDSDSDCASLGKLTWQTYYCAQYSEYSYVRQCQPCADISYTYQISNLAVDLLGNSYPDVNTPSSVAGNGESVHTELHTCSDFSDWLNESAKCISCEWGFNPQMKHVLLSGGHTPQDLCQDNHWQLRLWSPEGNGWGGAQYRINACNHSVDCGVGDSTLIARGSPVASRHTNSEGITTEFTRNVCWQTLDKLSEFTLVDTPGVQSGATCYRMTSWWKPDSANRQSTPIQSQMITWELTDTTENATNVIASGGVGTFLFSFTLPVDDNVLTQGSGTRRLQSPVITTTDGCKGVSVCTNTSVNVVVEVQPTLDSETGVMRRDGRERWTLVSRSVQYEFPLCKELPRLDSNERIEGAENCVHVPASGKLLYSLCLPSDSSTDENYRFTFFSSGQTQSQWSVAVSMLDGESERYTSDSSSTICSNHTDSANRMSQTCTVSFTTRLMGGTTSDDICSVDCSDDDRLRSTPCVDCGGKCLLSSSLGNGQCNTEWNCAAYGYDMDDCRFENGDGWSVDTFYRKDKGNEMSWLSISEGDRQQLVLGSNGVVYTQDRDGNDGRDETFVSSVPASAPQGSCNEQTPLQNNWFCCVASDSSLTFWYNRELLLSMTVDGRIWSSGGHGYFDQINGTYKESEHKIKATYSELSTLRLTSGRVGRLCLSDPCGPDNKTIGNWDLLEVFDQTSASWSLCFFWQSHLKFVVQSNGDVWASYHGGSLLNRTGTMAANEVLPTNSSGSDEFSEVEAQISVSGSYSLYVAGEYVGTGVDCVDDCADSVPQADQRPFGVRCDANPLVIAIAASCMNRKSHDGRCCMKFQVDVPRPPSCKDSSDRTVYSAAQSSDGSDFFWKCHAKPQLDIQCVRDGKKQTCWADTEYDDSSWMQPTAYGSDTSKLGYDSPAVWPTGGAQWRWSKDSEWIWLENGQNTSQVVCRGTWKYANNHRNHRPSQAPVVRHAEESSGLATVFVLILLITVFACGAIVWRVHIVHSRKFDGLLEQAIDGEYSGFETVTYAPDEMEEAVHDSIMSRFEEDNAAIDTILHESALEDLEIECVIGRGSSSVVYRAVWKGRQVALKQLLMDSTEVMQVLDEFTAEIRIMSKLRHPNVIHYVGFTTTPRCLIIQEYASNGDLRSYLDPFATQPDNRNAPTQAMQLSLALDIIRGMSYLHTQKPIVLHRDLKTPNLLLDLRDGEYCVKITDFGLAREKSELAGATGLMTVCGTPLWTAPEILKGEHYNEKADVFSAALCLWELWSFTVPHVELGIGPMEVVLKVASEDIRPRIPPGMPEFFVDMVQRCWARDPTERPRFPDLVREVETYAEGISHIKIIH